MIALVAVLCLAAVAVVREFPTDRLKWRSVQLLPQAFRVDQIVFEGVPPRLGEILMRELDARPVVWGPWRPYGEARRLRHDFPFLASLSVDRDWKARRVTFNVSLRTPIAKVSRSSKPWGWLTDDGVMFPASGAFFADAGQPEIELGKDGDVDAPALAAFLREAESSAAFPAKLVRAEYRSQQQGWELSLADGSKIFWGDLRWTSEKLERLNEVLGDARTRGKAGWTPDLRYFDQGRIFLRPRSAAH